MGFSRVRVNKVDMGFSGVRVNKVDMGFSGVRVNRSVVVCVCFVDRCLSLVLYLLVIVLSVVLRFTDSDYPFGIFKLFLRPY
jgi:hypothetical protein